MRIHHFCPYTYHDPHKNLIKRIKKGYFSSKNDQLYVSKVYLNHNEDPLSGAVHL